MTKTLKITLTEKNSEEINKLLDHFLESEFLKFCLINDLVNEGIKKLKKNYYHLDVLRLIE